MNNYTSLSRLVSVRKHEYYLYTVNKHGLKDFIKLKE